MDDIIEAVRDYCSDAVDKVEKLILDEPPLKEKEQMSSITSASTQQYCFLHQHE